MAIPNTSCRRFNILTYISLDQPEYNLLLFPVLYSKKLAIAQEACYLWSDNERSGKLYHYFSGDSWNPGFFNREHNF